MGSNPVAAIMKNYITSDLHLSHRAIIKHCRRPFLCKRDQDYLLHIGGTWDEGRWGVPAGKDFKISIESVELSNENLIKNINETVGRKDRLIILGDFVYGVRNKREYYRECRRLRDLIKCENVTLVHGNHDRDIARDLFTSVRDILTIWHNSTLIMMSHYPMFSWRNSHHGSIHLYGHCHSNAEMVLESIMPNRRSMDVGIDNAAKLLGCYRPFSLEDEIMPMMLGREGYCVRGRMREEKHVKIHREEEVQA